MVFVNNKKFACESCIKGHRSSSCHHTDRPLFEIKKKGRPVSQCEKCRELRQSRRVHSKCNCPQDEAPSRGVLLPSSSSKSRRYIPIVPALPNGLRDALPASSRPAVLPDSRQRVDSLLNPCHCRSGWKCNCRAEDAPEASAPNASLATLARAAALCCSTDPPTPRAAGPSTSKNQQEKRQTSRPPSPAHITHGHKRPKCVPATTERAPGPDLPPLLLSFYDEDASPSPSPSIPTFATMPTMPPISKITSLAGSGCTCGLECACPGCVEHRGAEHADRDRPSCAHGCGTCVDAHAVVALPLPGFSSDFNLNLGEGANSIIDQFFARAAALPLPPSNRTTGVSVDPTSVLVGRPAVPNLLPKLQCCGGQCVCPEGSCDCRKTCDGACAEHRNQARGAINNGRIDAGAAVAFPFGHPRSSPAKGCCGAR